MAPISAISCPGCRGPLPTEALNAQEEVRCPRCGGAVVARVFPALYQRAEAVRPEAIRADEGEATCFYHAGKRAAVACEECGRFVCALCDVEVGGRHLCPGCVGAATSAATARRGRKKKDRPADKGLDNRRTLYDDMALALAVAPILVWPLTFMTAPAALFIAVRYWNSPTSVVGRTKSRYVAAIVVALLQMTGWGLLIYSLISEGG